MADNQTVGLFQRMHEAGVAQGKQEGRDVAGTLKRIIDCFMYGMGGQHTMTAQPAADANQVSFDKLANAIEVNSAIVQSVCAIVVADTGHIIGAIPPADAMFGYAVGELAGRHVDVAELIPSDLRDTYMTHWRKFWANPRNVGVTATAGAAGEPVDSVRMQAVRLTGEQMTIKVGWGHPVFVLFQRAVVAQIMHVPLWQDALEVKATNALGS